MLSIIVPLYNALALTQAMLASLRATLPPSVSHEIIFVDDGSTDGTREWLHTLHDPAVRVVLNERNSGYAISNNRGASVARGEYLALLNNDLILLPRWLEPMLDAHRTLGERAGVVGNVQLNARTGVIDHTGIIFDTKAKPEHDRSAPTWRQRVFEPIRRVPAATAACVIISRALWNQLDGFDERYVNGGEDVDFCFRARAIGRVNAVALRSVVRHHVSASAGRKLHDEANSERLARRWRNEFVACATRPWCRHQFELIFRDPRGCEFLPAWRLWTHAVGLTQVAPSEATEALHASLDAEFARWRHLGMLSGRLKAEG